MIGNLRFKLMSNIVVGPQILNFHRLVLLVDDIGQKTVESVIQKSKADLIHKLCEVATAALAKDWSTLRIAVHSVSGLSAIIGAERLRDIASEVEDNCIRQDFSMASHNLIDVMLEIASFLKVLERVNLSALYSQYSHSGANSISSIS
jgi:HPt (histidine-containing phosphotransfer) domain-containing protein